MNDITTCGLNKRIRRSRDIKISSDESLNRLEYEFVVVGGGIAGISCAQELATITNQKILVISASDTIKEAVSTMTLTSHLSEVSVYERLSACITSENPHIEILRGEVTHINEFLKEISLLGTIRSLHSLYRSNQCLRWTEGPIWSSVCMCRSSPKTHRQASSYHWIKRHGECLHS